MKLLFFLPILILSSCETITHYDFNVFEIDNNITVEYLLTSDFFQTDGHVLLFGSTIADTAIFIQFERDFENKKLTLYGISWTFPISSDLTEAKKELKKIGIESFKELFKDDECLRYGSTQVEKCPSSVTLIGKSVKDEYFLIDWSTKDGILASDPYPSYEINVRYSFNESIDETYNLHSKPVKPLFGKPVPIKD